MKTLGLILLSSLFVMPVWSQSTMLEVGDRAPAFDLPDQNGEQVKLEDFLGKKNVVLAFYVLAFTGG
jgi:peroxiredoxin